MTRIAQSIRALRLPLLALATASTLGLSACDGEVYDLDEDELGLELDEEHEGEPVAVSAGELGVALDPETQPESQPATIINIDTYAGVRRLDDVLDGELLLLANVEHGYVGCDVNDELQASHAPSSTEGFVWKAHRVDIDQNGTDEIQLELLDATTPTGKFLKMNGAGDVFCAAIGGIGDAAAWEFQAAYATGGTYKRTWTTLENYKQGECLSIDGSAAASGVDCAGSTFAKGFTLEFINAY